MSTTGRPPGEDSGVMLGVDVGEVRVGLAASDPRGVLAHPVATLARDQESGTDLDRIVEEALEREAVLVVVGLPRSLSGEEGVAAQRARQYAVALQRRLQVPVRLWDERLTTVDAHRSLRESGVKGRDQRGIVDQAAATLILQGALEARGAGRPPGASLKARKPRTARSSVTDTKDGR